MRISRALVLVPVMALGCGGNGEPDPGAPAGAGGSAAAAAGASGKAGGAGASSGKGGAAGATAGKGGAAGASAGKGGAAGASAGGAAGKSGGGASGAAGASGKGGAAGGSGKGGAAGAGGAGGASGIGGSAGASGAGAGGAGGATPTTPVFLPEKTSLGADDVAILINTDDPQSVAVGEHYRVARGIPSAHVIALPLGAGLGVSIGADVFAKWKTMIDAATPASVQAFAVSWTQPTVVDCMSLTSALAFGFDKKWCNQSGGCGSTAQSPYFDVDTHAPQTALGVRPAIVLAGVSTADAITFIDRGVAADGTFPTGDGWLLRTTDSARSVRYFEFQQSIAAWSHPEVLKLTYVDNAMGTGKDYIEGQKDVLFYLTGLADVPMIKSNTYRPGALADHLTSYGGQIPNSGQMSILRWLEAGATGSFGTVVEPCNYTTKFPDSTVLLPRYYRGETLLEAYWKSVAWPGEGLFIGEPLAKPWGTKTAFAGGMLTITTTTMAVGKTYAIESAPAPTGPWTQVQGNVTIPYLQAATLTVPNATAAYYRLKGP